MIEVGLFWSHSGSRGWDCFRAGTCSIWWALFLPSDGGYFCCAYLFRRRTQPPPAPSPLVQSSVWILQGGCCSMYSR